MTVFGNSVYNLWTMSRNGWTSNSVFLMFAFAINDEFFPSFLGKKNENFYPKMVDNSYANL